MPAIAESPAIHNDPWLGEHLQCAAYRIDPDMLLRDAGDLAARRVRALLDAVAGPLFAYARVPVADVAAVGSLERIGFRVVDTTLTLESETCRLTQASNPDGVLVRSARLDDESAVVALAARSFEFSRFHLDPSIARDVADSIKSAWVSNFFRGRRGDAMIVAETTDSGARPAIAGFLLALNQPCKTMTIDLVAVDKPCRGRGIAGAMTRAACNACPHATTLRVGTQLANFAAFAAYQRMGFSMVGAQYVLHYHRTAPAAPAGRIHRPIVTQAH